jgi:hypothetical protein
MANKTLLQSVNEVGKRASWIAGDAGALASLTDTGRQLFIDQTVQVINEGISELYTTSEIAHPNEQAESTVALQTGTRAYSLATDLVQLRWPLRDKTNNQFIVEMPGGYDAILNLDVQQDDTGLPYYAAIRPTDGKLHLDRAPTSVENGRTYTYQYDKSLLMSLLTDAVPFNDNVFYAMVPVWVQLYKRDARGEFDNELFKMHLGRASRILTQREQRASYTCRPGC